MIPCFKHLDMIIRHECLAFYSKGLSDDLEPNAATTYTKIGEILISSTIYNYDASEPPSRWLVMWMLGRKMWKAAVNCHEASSGLELGHTSCFWNYVIQ